MRKLVYAYNTCRMLEWEDGWGQNGGTVGMFLIKYEMFPPIVCAHDAFTP
jgi:hypothetical protein